MNTIFSSFQTSFNYLISGSSFDHLLILILIGIIFQLKDLKKYFTLMLALIIGTGIGFLLNTLNIFNFSIYSIKLTMAISILAVGIHNLLSTNTVINAIRYNFFAIIGIIMGIGLNNYYEKIYPSKLAFTTVLGFNLGILTAYLAITIISLLLSSLVLLIFKIEKKNYHIAMAGIGIGISLMLIFFRY